MIFASLIVWFMRSTWPFVQGWFGWNKASPCLECKPHDFTTVCITDKCSKLRIKAVRRKCTRKVLFGVCVHHFVVGENLVGDFLSDNEYGVQMQQNKPL